MSEVKSRKQRLAEELLGDWKEVAEEIETNEQALIDDLLGDLPKEERPLAVFDYLKELELIQELIGVPVVWQPLPGSQELAVTCPADMILYEGTRGPGKTDAQIMFFRQFVGQGYGSFWKGIIFDQKYKNLDDIISKSKRWFPEFRDEAKFTASSGLKWVWPTGEELLFRHMERDSDYWNYHGQEYPFIGWNELTKYPTPDLFDAMMSCNRSSFIPEKHSPRNPLTGKIERVLDPIRLVVFATTNPFGPGHNWVKARFINPAPPGVIVRKTTNVFNPRTQKHEDYTRTQVRIFGSYKENIFLPPQYVAELEAITEPNKRRAWIWGDWDIVAGGAFDDLWDDTRHIIPRFIPPATWRIDRSLDWGSTKPFSVGWWAEANGEEVQLLEPYRGKKTWCPPKGTLIRCHEWYGNKGELGFNVGLKKGGRKVAKGIKAEEKILMANGWFKTKPMAGPADNQIFGGGDDEQGCIADLMAAEGIYWNRSDKSPGSRKTGLQVIRDAMENVLDDPDELPGLYIMDHCRAFISLVPVLPRCEKDPDEIDQRAEDHCYDEARYRIAKNSQHFDRPLTLQYAH